MAAALDVTERTAFGIVDDLADGGYLKKERAGRRNRYGVQAHLALGDDLVAQRTLGDLLAVLTDTSA